MEGFGLKLREPCIPDRSILLNEACSEQSLKNSEQTRYTEKCGKNVHIAYKIYLKRKTVVKKSSW